MKEAIWEFLIPLIIFGIGYLIGMNSPKKSGSSPIGMSFAALGIALSIPYSFEVSDWHGWIMVGFSVLFLIIAIKSYIIYCNLNKLDEDE